MLYIYAVNKQQLLVVLIVGNSDSMLCEVIIKCCSSEVIQARNYTLG